MASTERLEREISPNLRIQLDKLRQLIKSYIDKHQYETALFWADKVSSLSQGEHYDVFWYAQTLFLTGQYHRAANMINTHALDKKHLACRYLKARCYYECKKWQEALDILDQQPSDLSSDSCQHDISALGLPSSKLASNINLLRGKAYEAMDNRNLAAECFREALCVDVHCHEAFQGLVTHHMLSSQEEQELMEMLPIDKQCSDDEAELLRFLYETQLKKYHKPNTLVIPPSLDRLKGNLDIMVSLAERYYYNCEFRSCFKITTVVLDKDPFNQQCLPIHIAVLVELKKSNDLFYLAHNLVDIYPDRALAWFAVGCYYLMIRKNEPARRYLSKATALDRVFGPAWLAYGHSFAAENEHDQAMAAYFTASQLMRGCHLPVLYIGLEYGLTNNTTLAERFFSQALTIAPQDPFVLHEMGVIAYQNQDWDMANNYFKMALEQVEVISQQGIVDIWEPLLSNLGHTCRKLRKYEQALDYHQQALVLCPKNPSTLSCIGYVHILTGNSAEAVDYFHKALSLRRDDTFATTMLGHAIEQLMSDMNPCIGIPESLPDYTYNSKLKAVVPVLVAPKFRLQLPMDTSADQSAQLSDNSSMAIDTDMDDTDTSLMQLDMATPSSLMQLDMVTPSSSDRGNV